MTKTLYSIDHLHPSIHVHQQEHARRAQIAANPSATAALVSLCRKNQWNPDPAAVQALVADGASLCFQIAAPEAWSMADLYVSTTGPMTPPRSSSHSPSAHALHTEAAPGQHSSHHISRKNKRMQWPVLHYLAYRGRAEAVSACLAASHTPLDFTLADGRGRTLLHVACDEVVCDAVTHRILQAVVRRLEAHPTDRVDWEQKDHRGHGVLKRAAENQKLALVWPLLADVPQIADRILPFHLSYVWRIDWERLPHAEREERFVAVRPHRMIEADAATARLCQLSWQPAAALADIEACVREGADVCYGKRGENVLQCFMARGRVDAVRACLTTQRPIDFAARDERGRTLLQWLLYVYADARCTVPHASRRSSGVSVLQSLLQEVVFRLKARHPGDVVPRWDQWNAADQEEQNIFTVAARYGCLSMVWLVISAYYHQSQQQQHDPKGANAIADTSVEDHHEANDANANVNKDGCPTITTSTPDARIHVTTPIFPEDWARIPEADRCCFVLHQHGVGWDSPSTSRDHTSADDVGEDSQHSDVDEEDTCVASSSEEYCF